ncbi:MAG: Tic22 family protein [Leptolyngbyaceae cyanobacterium bins.59]|nr:Tic22 family protein [Leptolyngbyaceae cyanobacterium bins.59]
MKSIARWSAVFGLVGGALIAPSLAGFASLLALTEEQILRALRPVPVFAIANSQGAPLVAAPPNGQQGSPVAGVFISQKDAQAFLDTLKTKNPELAKDVRVVPVSLGEVYQLGQANKNRPEKLEFAYVPMVQQVQTAVNLLKQGGQKIEQFNGVPLFLARGGADKGYLTIQRGNEQVIPLFFKKEELQSMLDRFKQQQPNLANTIDIQVVNLEGVIQTLQTSNNQQLTQIVLIPPQESLEYVQKNLPAGQAGQNQQRPATPAPANPPKK